MIATSSSSVFPYEPTQDERTFATLAHALQMVGWWIAPLVILITKRESKFVSFHALQALLLQVLYLLVLVIMMVTFLATTVTTSSGQMPQTSQPPNQEGGLLPWLSFFLPLVWLLVWMPGWVIAIVVSILYSIKAGRGQWAQYPLLGRLARRILHLPTT